MELYPSIDLRGGQVVRLRQGVFADETIYGADALAVACSYAEAGAPWVHVVDLDAARGKGDNRSVIAAIVGAIAVPVQVGGGIRDGSLLSEGVARIVVGSSALAPGGEELVGAMGEQWPGKVAVGLDHRDRQVMVRGWEAGSGIDLLEAAARLALPGVASFVATDIGRDGMLSGPDLSGYIELMATTSVPVVASGGVSSLLDLRALAAIGVAGAIVGKALYEGLFTVAEALEAISD